jgi:hypothetical protein
MTHDGAAEADDEDDERAADALLGWGRVARYVRAPFVIASVGRGALDKYCLIVHRLVLPGQIFLPVSPYVFGACKLRRLRIGATWHHHII